MFGLVVEMIIGLVAALIYPRLLKVKARKKLIYVLIVLSFGLGIITGVGFILLWFLGLFILVRKFVNKKYADWRISSSIYIEYLAILLVIYKVVPMWTKLPSITFFAAIAWLSEQFNLNELKNAGLTFSGGVMFLQVVTLILSSLLGVEPSILKLM